MKTLSIYKENESYVIEEKNKLNHSSKKEFSTLEQLKEGLKAYKSVLEQYQLDVSTELWATLINFLSSREFQD